MGLFGSLFDLDGDGRLDALEQAAELGFFMEMMDDEKSAALTAAGLDPMALEEMGYWERREALEQAGLDPDEFDCD